MTETTEMQEAAEPPVGHLRDVCRMGQGAACCRYLTAGAAGMACAKHDGMALIIDARVAAGTFTARGDNCDGYSLSVVLA